MNLLLYLFITRATKPIVVVTAEYHCYQLHTNFIQYCCLKVNSIVDEIIGGHQCGF
jgi:hypothetical protein